MSFTTAFPILHTDDVKGLVTFYSQIMGLPVTSQAPIVDDVVFVTVGVGDSTIGIGTYEAIERFVGALPRGGRAFQICLYTDDIDADIERLRITGVTVHTEPFEHPWGGRIAHIADPDGNIIMLTQPLASG